MNKRIVAIGALVTAAIAVLIIVVVIATGDDDYKVRAIFDNAAFITKGQDVRISGVTVGKVDDLELTANNKAAIVLNITNEGFQDFRIDASCIVRPQSLIGERYIECQPTQLKPEGTDPAPLLQTIPEGEPGEGDYLIPLRNNGNAVDIDLILNILRRPFAERMTIILNELGVGLAANGEELREVIRRANPALRETDKVLALLAEQNNTLASLVTDSDRILAPLAREREHVADFIVQANITNQAIAAQSSALGRTVALFPQFQRELRINLTLLGRLARQTIPVLSNLGAAAPDINRLIANTAPFAQAAVPAIQTLGDAADVGTVALPAVKPDVDLINQLAKDFVPVASSLRALTVSLEKTGGLESILNYIFFQALSLNGFDSFGHYLRVGLLVSSVALCSNYSTAPVPGCSANFEDSTTEESETEISSSEDGLSRSAAVLRGESPEDVLAEEKNLDSDLEKIDRTDENQKRELKSKNKDSGLQDGEAEALDYLLGPEEEEQP